MSDEGFGVVVVVGWISAIEKGVVNLLPYPSLACGDWRVAVIAIFHAMHDHFASVRSHSLSGW
jgi:hypothetical protein